MSLANLNAALAYLALRGRLTPSQQEAITQIITPGAANSGNPGLPIAPHLYAQHAWVDLLRGDDKFANVGTFEKPYRTIQAWALATGAPANQADYERPRILHVYGHSVADIRPVELPRSRRLVIQGHGGVRIPSMAYRYDDADRFGSPLQFFLNVCGDPMPAVSGAFEAQRFPLGAVLLQAIGTLPCLTIEKLTPLVLSGLSLAFENVQLNGLAGSGAGVSMVGYGTFPLEPLWSFRDVHIDLNGNVFGAPGVGVLMECLRLIQTDSTDDVFFDNVSHMEASIIAGDWTVAASPDPTFRRGILGSNWLGASSWTGPAGSMQLDATTNFILKLNGATIAAAAKTILEDVVP